eukprot:TRINITY_DN94812_c0_g1_i1.p1 TRINITY_DN94812_c0_g1~~TRINITY_DN94812_c0_g1_i1.p1  ORF type:complete len:232 (+),score=35.90 TRINITY_DN94812_c0_g1_i1:187-882(+)
MFSGTMDRLYHSVEAVEGEISSEVTKNVQEEVITNRGEVIGEARLRRVVHGGASRDETSAAVHHGALRHFTPSQRAAGINYQVHEGTLEEWQLAAAVAYEEVIADRLDMYRNQMCQEMELLEKVKAKIDWMRKYKAAESDSEESSADTDDPIEVERSNTRRQRRNFRRHLETVRKVSQGTHFHPRNQDRFPVWDASATRPLRAAQSSPSTALGRVPHGSRSRSPTTIVREG